MTDAVILGAVRTAIGKRNGALAQVRPDELLARTIAELVRRTGVDPAQVEDVVAGCVTQVGEQGFNIARIAALMAGLPVEVTGATVNRQCGSGQQALSFAAMAVMAEQHEVVIAAGVENMSRIPLGADVQGPKPFFPASKMLTERYKTPRQHESAEMVAEKWGISRRECDEIAYDSHMRAAAARASGRFKDEIFPIEAPAADGGARVFAEDEGIRPDTSLEKLAALEVVTSRGPKGCVTAGTSSQISDGACAILVASAKKARELGLRPRARIVATAMAGVDPVLMLSGPIPATRKILAKTGLALGDIGLFEVNEAFASVPAAWRKELGVDWGKVNVNGGACALGHPLGCSGVRLTTTLLHELEKRDVRYGLVTMCIGFGQGTATILDRRV